ncbi:hypothetical protein B0H10DRAFT_663217 [Mycena sp. CBHHK59/15]|nr:hypothetical protein B0H10DRAFT_663217 [Mycena sp. CBHHK59/15]
MPRTHTETRAPVRLVSRVQAPRPRIAPISQRAARTTLRPTRHSATASATRPVPRPTALRVPTTATARYTDHSGGTA